MKKIYILTIILCGVLSCKSNNSEQYATKRPNCKTTINNHDNSINEIYSIINKANISQTISEDEMIILLKSYNEHENNIELSQYRAVGIASIIMNHNNCTTLLRVLETNPCLYREDICDDMMFTEEDIDTVISKIKEVPGFNDIKIKILEKLGEADAETVPKRGS